PRSKEDSHGGIPLARTAALSRAVRARIARRRCSGCRCARRARGTRAGAGDGAPKGRARALAAGAQGECGPAPRGRPRASSEVEREGLDAFERIGEETSEVLERRPQSLVV